MRPKLFRRDEILFAPDLLNETGDEIADDCTQCHD